MPSDTTGPGQQFRQYWPDFCGALPISCLTQNRTWLAHFYVTTLKLGYTVRDVIERAPESASQQLRMK